MQTIKAVQDVLTVCPHSVGLDQPLEVAERLMREHQIRHLPVQSAGKLVGVISDRDLKSAMSWSISTDKQLMVDEAYIPEPYIVAPETPLTEVLERLVAERIGCALVVAKDKLVGIFTTTDACRILARALRHEVAF